MWKECKLPHSTNFSPHSTPWCQAVLVLKAELLLPAQVPLLEPLHYATFRNRDGPNVLECGEGRGKCLKNLEKPGRMMKLFLSHFQLICYCGPKSASQEITETIPFIRAYQSSRNSIFLSLLSISVLQGIICKARIYSLWLEQTGSCDTVLQTHYSSQVSCLTVLGSDKQVSSFCQNLFSTHLSFYLGRGEKNLKKYQFTAIPNNKFI